MTQKPRNVSVVLVVEDEELVRLGACSMLQDAGYEVIEAAGADQALAILKSRSDVGVLFTDVQMPGRLDGLELALEVHEQWPLVHLLLTSGNVTPERRAFPRDGRFLAKPYGGEQMVREIGRLIDEAA